jgi:hypothetical protein
MTVEVIGVIAVLIGLISLYREPSFIVYVFVCSTLLGAAAGLILQSLGGASVSPAHLLLGFLAFRLFRNPTIAREIAETLRFGRPGFWLLLTVVFALGTAFLLPRLFAGQTYVFPVRAQNELIAPLEPANSNLTQSVYFVGDLICFLLIDGFAATRFGPRILLKVGLSAAVLNLVFAAVDLLTYFTNTAELLSFIRNASYTIYADDQAAGFKRIVGSFTESSSFGSMTLGYFAFTSRLWLMGVYPRFTFVSTFLLLLALIFATSTTAYVGLAMYSVILYLEVVLRVIAGPVPRPMLYATFCVPFVLLVVGIAVALNDPAWSYLQSLLNSFVFDKLYTASGAERSSWNRQALQSFFDTFGFGVGNGSVRASSFLVAVPASLGVIGTVIFGMFLSGLFLSRRQDDNQDPLRPVVQLGAKSACLGWLISSSISNTQIDLGLAFYIFAGIACSGQTCFDRVNPQSREGRVSEAVVNRS